MQHNTKKERKKEKKERKKKGLYHLQYDQRLVSNVDQMTSKEIKSPSS